MRSLEDVLETEYGLNLLGWELRSVEGVSDDGTTLVGYGISPDGHSEAWLARMTTPVPAPSSAVGMTGLFAMGIAASWWRRRRKPLRPRSQQDTQPHRCSCRWGVFVGQPRRRLGERGRQCSLSRVHRMGPPSGIYWQSPGARTGSLLRGLNRAGGYCRLSAFLAVASGRAWQKGSHMASQWFYQSGGQQSGPVDSWTLRRLAETGIVKPETLVRKGEAALETRGEDPGAFVWRDFAGAAARTAASYAPFQQPIDARGGIGPIRRSDENSTATSVGSGVWLAW